MNELNYVQFAMIVILMIFLSLWRSKAIEYAEVLKTLAKPRYIIFDTGEENDDARTTAEIEEGSK